MPLSTDNQDYGQSDKKNEKAGNTEKPQSSSSNKAGEENSQMSSDNLKGKKVDADLSKDSDKPANV